MTVLYRLLAISLVANWAAYAFIKSAACFRPKCKFGGGTSTSLATSIQPGDKVLVIGGTGGVGQLVTSKLKSKGAFHVRVTSRSKSRGEETIDDDGVEIVELDLIQSSDDGQMDSALEGVAAAVISVGTTAFPTIKWSGGNTPDAIDNLAVSRIAEAAAKVNSLKKVVLLTSVGVSRTNQMPFLILNLFGVLDAKRKGEEAVKRASAQGNFDYVIVRPGRLIGGPFTNLDVAKLLQIEGGAENGVDIALGDSLLGDCKRDACAEAVVQCLLSDECQNVEFSIISNDQKALTDREWSQLFRTMRLSVA